MLFKEFAGVDAFPICLDTQDADEIVRAVELMAPTFGGINLEDISAPRCFEIEDRLKESIDIPVFHDDQHGTAVVTMAALFNALKITGKPIEELRVLVVGLGAAGVAVTKMMLASGITKIVGCDRQGALSTARADYESGEMNEAKRWYAENSNPQLIQGQPDDVIEGMRVERRVSRQPFRSPDHYIEFFRTYFGPTKTAYERVGPEGEAALTEDLRSFLAAANEAGERAMVLEAEYLEVIATRA